MKPKTFMLGILADRVDVAVVHGSASVSTQRLEFQGGADVASWLKALRALAGPLKQAVQQMSAQGLPAIVIYRSPSAVAEFTTSRLTQSQAAAAAALSCVDALGIASDHAVCQSVIVGTEKSGDETGTHLVTTAERADVAAAIQELVEDAGLVLDSSTPIDAANLARLTQSASHHGDATSAQLYIGESSSFFIIVHDGALAFARRITLGTDTMASSMTRPIRTVGGGEALELSLNSARRIIFEHGFESLDRVVDDRIGLTCGHLIPALQPVLQRLVIELRQSLRFGLPESHRSSVQILVSGPGSSVPGMVSTLSRELALDVRVGQGADSPADPDSGACGRELLDALGDRRTLQRLNLQPRSLAGRKSASRLRKWLVVGAAAAAAVIALDAFRFHHLLELARQEAELLASRSEDAAAVQEAIAKFTGTFAEMGKLEQAIHQAAGLRVDYASCLKELSLRAPESIRFNSISLRQQENGTVCELTGYAMLPDAAAQRTELESFISSLRESRLFERVMLDAVQVASVAEEPAQRFTATCIAVPVPRPALSALGSAAAQGGPRS